MWFVVLQTDSAEARLREQTMQNGSNLMSTPRFQHGERHAHYSMSATALTMQQPVNPTAPVGDNPRFSPWQSHPERLSLEHSSTVALDKQQEVVVGRHIATPREMHEWELEQPQHGSMVAQGPFVPGPSTGYG
jgi:hypothetical protein